jgi:hypothetical protein
LKTARRLLFTFLLYLALGAAPALGHNPWTVGSGFGYDLAVGSSGRGHIVFLADESPSDRVHYCRIASGAQGGCDDQSKTLDFPGGGSAVTVGHEAQVFTFGAKVVIAASCSSCGSGGGDHTYRWSSVNSGVSFGAPTEIGNLALNGQSSSIADPIVLGVRGGLFQAMDTAPPETAQLDLSGDPAFATSSSAAASGGKAVWAANNGNAVRYSVFTDPSGGATTAAEYNTIANWQTGLSLPGAEPGNSETHLSGGPSGIFLTYRNGNNVGLRKLDPTANAFTAPAYIQGSDPIDINTLEYPHHSQDASGRLHVVWRSAYGGGRLRYTASTDGGATFSPVATIGREEPFINPMMETAPSRPGHAIWQTPDGTIRSIAVHAGVEALDDNVRPAVTGFTMSDRTLRSGQGTTFRFTASEDGTAVITIEKRVAGLKMKQKGKRKLRCVPKTRGRLRKLARTLSKRQLKRRRCKAYKRVGRIRKAVSEGRNEINWNGRIRGRALPRGSYRAKIVVTDDAGNKSRPKTIRFRVS